MLKNSTNSVDAFFNSLLKNGNFSTNCKTMPSKGPTKIEHILTALSGTPPFDSQSLNTIMKGFSIKKAWAKTVGANIAKRAQPLKIAGKTLYVTVATSTWMEELKYIKADIIKKLNYELKETAVEDIVFRLGKVSEDGGQESAATKRGHKQPARRTMGITDDTIDRLVRPVKDGELREVIRRAIINMQDKYTGQ